MPTLFPFSPPPTPPPPRHAVGERQPVRGAHGLNPQSLPLPLSLSLVRTLSLREVEVYDHAQLDAPVRALGPLHVSCCQVERKPAAFPDRCRVCADTARKVLILFWPDKVGTRWGQEGGQEGGHGGEGWGKMGGGGKGWVV